MALDLEDGLAGLGSNAAFVADLFANWLQNPGSVDASWQSFFEDLKTDQQEVLAELSGAEWARPGGAFISETGIMADAAPDIAEPKPRGGKKQAGAAVDAAQVQSQIRDSIRVIMLIRAYRIRGHLMASLDPLVQEPHKYHPELDPKTYGFTDEDMDREFFLDNVLGLEKATLKDILAILRKTYCGNIGIEFMHIMYPEQKAWLQQRIEAAAGDFNLDDGDKRELLRTLTRADGFERFLNVKYPGTKRFGVEGGESVVPLIDALLEQSAELGVEECVLGMAHRGRLNVLANVMGKSYSQIFSEFAGMTNVPDDVEGSGDVKYHLGTSTDRKFKGKDMHLSLTANPSHLEVVNPVVMGKVRAKQKQKGDADRRRVMGLLIHGDAAFAGQGVVGEGFCMSEIKGYKTGGTFHLIINNQIGFTTNPRHSRSTVYPSDIAKGVQAPIFHVNGDDPEACAWVAKLAAAFRLEFKRDVVVDLYCYRRAGHNEIDEPSFTQPVMYKKIADHPTSRQIYTQKLIGAGTVSEAEAEEINSSFQNHLEDQFATAKSFKPNKADWLDGKWSGLARATGDDRRGKTGVPMDDLQKVGTALSKIPDNFNIHKTVNRLVGVKKKMFETGAGIDWATGEALAFGTLILEGTGVRLSGQDCGRGTFSQRHSVWRDQVDESEYKPLNNIEGAQAKYEVLDSLLSELGVLGFEYGYTLAEPNTLTLWEAQFGDFANGAQMIIDQFISSGESKWLRMSGLVMLLPHGYEGQGPEHSSARPERYLQMCGEDNWQIVNCTTPANYYHVLRRQVRRDFRKPLVVFSPKSLLRHKMCVSNLEDFSTESTFHRVLWDDYCKVPDKKVKRVILCTGKVYYDLVDAREKNGMDDTYIMRVEQLYPFPEGPLRAELGRFGKNIDVVWCQEEPKNMGAWSFINWRIEDVMDELKLKNHRIKYAGRTEAASPATGSGARHKKELEAFLEDAFTI